MNTAQYVLDNAATQPHEVRQILIDLAKKGETAADLIAFYDELSARKIPVGTDHVSKPIFDICGTGGSGKSRINLSTALAVKLSAEFCIAKHGNNAASGKVGSFDLIDRLDFDRADTPVLVVQQLQEQNLSFVFAPAFHPALKSLAPIRSSIPHRTIFNLLGPLLNPVDLTAQMIGISDPGVGDILAELAKIRGKNVLFVHDTVFGLDDVSIGGATQFWKVANGKIETGTFVPDDFGIQRMTDFAQIAGGDVETNQTIFTELVNETASDAHTNFLQINQRVAEDFFRGFFKE